MAVIRYLSNYKLINKDLSRVGSLNLGISNSIGNKNFKSGI